MLFLTSSQNLLLLNIDTNQISNPKTEISSYKQNLELFKEKSILGNNESSWMELQEVGRYDQSGVPEKFVTYGIYGFLADKDGGLKIFDIQDLKHPEIISSYQNDNNVWDVVVESSFIFLANGYGGVSILNFDLPSNPE